jgi:glycosyltransferase involved in cell wall biosynthesis
LKLAFDDLISFSSVPLRLASWLGAMAALLGFAYLLYAFFARLVGVSIPEGWTSTVVTILFLGGTQLMVLGILGDYIGRIFDEVKNRPNFIPRETFGWLNGRLPKLEGSDAANVR